MKSVYIFLAFEDSFWGDLVFLKSSQASQNSIFSSQNSDFKKALNAARPSVGGGEEQAECELSDQLIPYILFPRTTIPPPLYIFLLFLDDSNFLDFIPASNLQNLGL